MLCSLKKRIKLNKYQINRRSSWCVVPFQSFASDVSEKKYENIFPLFLFKYFFDLNFYIRFISFINC